MGVWGMSPRIGGFVHIAVVVACVSSVSLAAYGAAASSHRHLRDHRVGLSFQGGGGGGGGGVVGDDLDAAIHFVDSAIKFERSAFGARTTLARNDDLKLSQADLTSAIEAVNFAEDESLLTLSELSSITADLRSALDTDGTVLRSNASAHSMILDAIHHKKLALDTLDSARTRTPRKAPKPNGRSGGGRTGPMEMLCSAIPNPAMLSLNGSFAASVRCTGLPAAIFVDASSTGLLSACKGGVDFNGATPPIVVGADARGQAQFSVAGSGCVPGTYPIIVTEGGGFFQSFVAPVTLRFPLNGG